MVTLYAWLCILLFYMLISHTRLVYQFEGFASGVVLVALCFILGMSCSVDDLRSCIQVILFQHVLTLICATMCGIAFDWNSQIISRNLRLSSYIS